jgi:hypothetical protein
MGGGVYVKETTTLICPLNLLKQGTEGHPFVMFAMAICYNGNQKGEAYETSFSW